MSIGGESSVQENKLSSMPDLIPALTAAEQRAAASLKWRTHEKLLQKYSCLPHIISSDQIYYRFLQRMFTIMMTNNVLPVQRAAARTLCIFLRYNRKQEQRHEVIQKLIEHSIRVGQNGNVYGCGKYTLLYSKEIFIVIKKLSLMIDNVVLNFKQFQKKNYEKDLLDQEKEREELLFLEMEQLEKEKHQNDGRSSSEKSFEKKHDSFRTRNASSLPASFSPNPVLPSTSRGTGNTADAKSSGSKDAPPRKATL
ncbi:protein phosphatase 4 regulatory subunit 4 [Cricetulus griseus]